MAKKQARSSSKRKTSASSTPDAIQLLRADHVAVQKLFKDFEKTDDDSRKQAIASTICKELTIHTTIEEEIFYPAARGALDDDDLMDEADVEHASAKELISQIEAGSPGEDQWDAKVTVLGEYINHHVKEEHEEMFPKVKKSGVDLKLLGAQMKARKQELSAGQAPRRSNHADSSKASRVSL